MCLPPNGPMPPVTTPETASKFDQEKQSKQESGKFLGKHAKGIDSEPTLLSNQPFMPAPRKTGRFDSVSSEESNSDESTTESYLEQNEWEAYLFANRAADQDGEFSIDYFDEFFALNSEQYPYYGTALVFLYAALHRHGQDDENFASLILTQAIASSGAPNDPKASLSTGDAAILLTNLSKTRPLNDQNMDSTIRNALKDYSETILQIFRELHYSNGYMDFLKDTAP